VPVLEVLDGLKLDDLPRWGEPERPQVKLPEPESVEVERHEPLRTIKIFLASSEELRKDRDEFDLYVRQQNDSCRKKGISLEIVRWEDFLDTVAKTRKQDLLWHHRTF
jgi:hypothetical protein